MKKYSLFFLFFSILVVGCSQGATETIAPVPPTVAPTQVEPTEIPPTETTAPTETASSEFELEDWKPVLAVQIDVSLSCNLLIDLINGALEVGKVSSELFSEIKALQEHTHALQNQTEQMDTDAPGGAHTEQLTSYVVILNDVIAQWMNDEINLGYASEYLQGECGTLADLLKDIREDIKSEGFDDTAIDELISGIENQ